MKLLKDKRGQETTTILVFIVLALIVAGLFALFYYNVYSTANDLTALAPSVTSAKAKLCTGLGGDQAAYCEYQELEDNEWINCAYHKNADFRKQIDDVVITPPTCLVTEENFCKTLAEEEGFKQASINGKICEDRSKIANGKEEVNIYFDDKEIALDSESPA